MVLSQHEVFTHALKLYECHEAIRLPVESLGLNASHWLRSLVKLRPPVMMTLVAPVARTALTRLCMPATWYPIPVQVPPSRRQVHAAVGLEKLLAKSGNGSLNRSKMTALLPLNAVATWLQNVGVNCAFGIGFWHVALISGQPA